jgi:hypothetical protein
LFKLTETPLATRVSKRVLSKVNTLIPINAAPMAAKTVMDEHSTIFKKQMVKGNNKKSRKLFFKGKKKHIDTPQFVGLKS